MSRHRRLRRAAFVSVPASRVELLTRDIVPLIDQPQTSFHKFLMLESQLANGSAVNVYLVDRYS